MSHNPPARRVVTLKAPLYDATGRCADIAVEAPALWDPYAAEMPEPEGLSEEQLDALGDMLHGRSEGVADQRRLDAADRAREFAGSW